MKTLMTAISFATLAFSPFAFAENHVTAKNCEIFIDKIAPWASSHGLRAASAWIKI